MLSYLVLQLALSEFRQNGFDLNRRIVMTNKENLLKAILNGSNKMVQVSDAESYTMLYDNDTALRFDVNRSGKYEGAIVAINT